LDGDKCKINLSLCQNWYELNTVTLATNTNIDVN
jgi:hypothetical protein